MPRASSNAPCNTQSQPLSFIEYRFTFLHLHLQHDTKGNLNISISSAPDREYRSCNNNSHVYWLRHTHTNMSRQHSFRRLFFKHSAPRLEIGVEKSRTHPSHLRVAHPPPTKIIGPLRSIRVRNARSFHLTVSVDANTSELNMNRLTSDH